MAAVMRRSAVILAVIVSAFAGIVAARNARDARPDHLLEDIAAMAASTTNDDRHAAVVRMLVARRLSYTVETFTLERPIGREPRTDGRNIVVTHGPRRGPILVVGAHYDAARLQDGSLSAGAVDNAASSVIIAKLASALSGEALGAQVRFVWFDMEELGLQGSAAYLRTHSSEPLGRMVNLDINAYGDTIMFGPSRTNDNSALRRALVMTCADESVDCVAFPQMPPGDDRSFASAGIAAMSIATLPALEAHQLWLLSHARPAETCRDTIAARVLRIIHSSEDKRDLVEPESIERTLRVVLSLVRTLTRRPSSARGW
jgi:peptidase M28-like protein